MLSRLLTSKNKAQLLAWVRLAYVAESSVRKLYGFDSTPNGIFARKPQEYSCDDILQEEEEK